MSLCCPNLLTKAQLTDPSTCPTVRSHGNAWLLSHQQPTLRVSEVTTGSPECRRDARQHAELQITVLLTLPVGTTSSANGYC